MSDIMDRAIKAMEDASWHFGLDHPGELCQYRTILIAALKVLRDNKISVGGCDSGWVWRETIDTLIQEGQE